MSEKKWEQETHFGEETSDTSWTITTQWSIVFCNASHRSTVPSFIANTLISLVNRQVLNGGRFLTKFDDFLSKLLLRKKNVHSTPISFLSTFIITFFEWLLQQGGITAHSRKRRLQLKIRTIENARLLFYCLTQSQLDYVSLWSQIYQNFNASLPLSIFWSKEYFLGLKRGHTELNR